LKPVFMFKIFAILACLVMCNKPSSKESVTDSLSQFLPDSTLTPGDTLPGAMKHICTSGYTATIRNVPEALKKQVYARYGIIHHKRGEYEIDHLIPLELGGSNSPENLWPQSYLTKPWNAHKKDRLENRLRRLVCTKKITLQEAQYAIAHNWIVAYKKYIQEPIDKEAEDSSEGD
jgi:hypothetical protein